MFIWKNASLPMLIVLGSWWLFILFWAVMAVRTKKTVHRQSRSEQRLYLWLLLIGTALIGGVTRFMGPLGIIARPLLRLGTLQWPAAAAAMLGVAIAIWARVALGRNWSGSITLKENHELVTAGPYAAIRHPIYTALILLYLALLLLIVSPSAIIGFALVVWSCWVKLKQEEALMLRQFPDSYPAYMARTKRLVPGLV